jgi:hypothetical protein
LFSNRFFKENEGSYDEDEWDRMSTTAKSFISLVKIDTKVKDLSKRVKGNIVDGLRQQHHRAMTQLKAKYPTFFPTSRKKSQEKVSTKSVITTEQENSKEVPEDPAKEDEQKNSKEVPEDPAKEEEKFQGKFSKEVPEDPAKEEEKFQGKFPIVEEKFAIVEEKFQGKFPIVEEKFQAESYKLLTAPIKQKINRAIQQSQIVKDLKQKFLDLISAPDLPWTFGETLDFDTFQITFNVKTK